MLTMMVTAVLYNCRFPNNHKGLEIMLLSISRSVIRQVGENAVGGNE
jgi:hypothetical protein